MGENDKLLEGADFTEFLIAFSKSTTRLCAETYKATRTSPPKPELVKLIATADTHIAEFRDLLKRYTGGRRESFQRIERHIESLTEFVDTLKKLSASQKP